LLPGLQAVFPALQAISARYSHLVASPQPPDAEQIGRLTALLQYGEPFVAARATSASVTTLVVTTRWGTVSPWAS
jgi:phosphoribosylformylglycinamidine synthase